MDNPIYRFAGVELDTTRRQLRAGDRVEEVSPLVFAALEHLARHANQVVSKDELSAILWPDRVVTDASITQTIRKSRYALERCGADPAVIKTRHGHGYLLDANVSIEGGSGEDSEETEWRKHPIRTGAIVAVLGGLLVTAANVTDVLQLILPDDSVQILEETQSTVETTDAKVDELIQLLRDQAARAGHGLDLDSEDTIRNALAVIVDSVDARKQVALDKLLEGDVDGAAASIVTVAQDLDTASARSVAAAASSWREAGAIYYTIDIEKAIHSYESAHELQPHEPSTVLDLAFSYVRAGRLEDALSLFEKVARMGVSPTHDATALRGAGNVRKLQGNYDVALELLSKAMDFAKQTGDKRQQGLVLLQQGAIARAQGENAAAREQFETAVRFAAEQEDPHFLAESLNNLGIVMAVTGDFESATHTLTQAYDIHIGRHDLAGQATVLGNLGATALTQGHVDAAENYLLESVALGEQLGWQRSIALDLINLGSIAVSRQQFDIGTKYLSRALDIAVSAQLSEIHPIILVNMGELARDQGNAVEACRLWGDALPLLEAMQHGASEIVVGYQDEADCP
ncbi:MAG: tetratricopeptide repeat protein [Woeseiaceae bacterium]|nr:tetratricopeptide repeat protein [Woeseiaceae bacterium]